MVALPAHLFLGQILLLPLEHYFLVMLPEVFQEAIRTPLDGEEGVDHGELQREGRRGA